MVTKVRAVTLGWMLGALVTACGESFHSNPNGAGDGGASNAGASSANGGSTSAGAGEDAGASGAQESAGAAGKGPVIGEQATSDKLDVLFVVDNSSSMAGKQAVLAASAPRLLSRLINPPCVDARGKLVAQPASAAAACPSGERQFTPVTDLHLGAISTSLGGQGGAMVCATGAGHLDDKAQLLPTVRTGLTSYQNSGFLAYDASGAAGDADASLVTSNLQGMLKAAGEDGCGFEAPLEAMYRFLADPQPPLSVTVVQQASTLTGVNDALLAQRKAFLRPDSAVAIVILSDENDCSIVTEGLGWFVGGLMRMPRATTTCDTIPNDPCCRSCAAPETTPPAGCAPISEDTTCSSKGTAAFTPWDILHDSLNLRCFDQKQRFGFDLLQPIERYTDALTSRKLLNRGGGVVDNPLFAARDGKGPRSPTLISVSVLVGAPWQDLATPASLKAEDPLELLDAAGLEREKRWTLLLGDPVHGVAPSDPFMVESVSPRMGMNPLTRTATVGADSTNPGANAINGHEQNVPDLSDLQYACTFRLPTPISCMPGQAACDCAASTGGDTSAVTAANSPLCQPPGGGPPGTVQYYGKGYPGTRELSFAHALGARAVAGSICPKALIDEPSSSFGYNAAFDALLARLAVTLR